MTRENNRNERGPRLGIDFGAGSLVIAAAVPGCVSTTVELPGISRAVPGHPGSGPVHLVPSLVEYRDGAVFRRGVEVLRGGSAPDPSTARWLRRYLCEGSTVRVPAGNGRRVQCDEAAADLLVPAITGALLAHPGASVVLTLPPGAPPAYHEFLRRAARSAGASSCSLLGEYEAALAGYGCTPAAGEPVVIVSLTESETVVAVVARGAPGAEPVDGGLRVLGQAACTTGCGSLDAGIVRDLLEKCRLLSCDPRSVRLLPHLRYEAIRLREQVYESGAQDVRLEDPGTGRRYTAVFSPADLDRILADTRIIPDLMECAGRALAAPGVQDGKGGIRSVLLIGSGSAIPAVQDAVRSRFPGAVVNADHPLDAVARGAAEHAAPVPVEDRIARSYALRYWDPAAQEHHYRFLVQGGTRFPSTGEVARIIISAAYDGQTLLGIPLYELGRTPDGTSRIELVSEHGGGVRLAGPVRDADNGREAVHVNVRSPTLIPATPPAMKGEPRFECTFTIDADRNLCLSARDLVTGVLVKVNAPVHRMT